MMTQRELHLEQFRECTVLLPTWCMARSIAQAVGGFVEALPGSGEAEDLIFFQKHLALHYAENSKHDYRRFCARAIIHTTPCCCTVGVLKARRLDAADDVCFKFERRRSRSGSYPRRAGKSLSFGRGATPKTL